MRKVIIGPNDSDQRLDRFLKKYFEKAPLSFIYKNLRKKNIKVDGKKASPEDLIKEGQEISLFISDGTIEKYKKDKLARNSQKFPQILYEDDNICLMKKPLNMLTHNDKNFYQDNMVDRFIDYLIFKEEYSPREENTFRPSICNRLDRNTSGILLGAKNAETLREINKAIKERLVDKFYLTIVKGKVQKPFEINIKLEKTDNNIMRKSCVGKDSLTKFFPLISNGEYSLLKVKLITGRTHQIRASLKEKGLYILGDRKYGKGKDKEFNSQALHNYLIKFNLDGELSYLNNREFKMMPPKKLSQLIEEIFNVRVDEIL